MTHVIRLVGWLKLCDLSLSLSLSLCKQAFSYACSLNLLTDWVCLEHMLDSADLACLDHKCQCTHLYAVWSHKV